MQSSVRDTHALYKIIDVNNIFLVWFCRKKCQTTLWPTAFADPSITKKGCNLSLDYFSLVKSIRRFPTAPRGMGSCTNHTFVTNDWAVKTFNTKAIPNYFIKAVVLITNLIGYPNLERINMSSGIGYFY